MESHLSKKTKPNPHVSSCILIQRQWTKRYWTANPRTMARFACVKSTFGREAPRAWILLSQRQPSKKRPYLPVFGAAKAGDQFVYFWGPGNTHVGQKKKYLLSCSGFKIIFQEFDRCPTLKILIIHFWVSNFDPFLPQEFKLTKLVGITSRYRFKFGANGPTKYNWLVQVWRYGCTTQLLSDKWQGRPFSCNGDVDLWIAVSIKLLCWSL